MTQRIFGLFLVTMFLVTGCSRNISSGAYDEDEAMTAVQTYEGKIINARTITVSGKSGMTDNPVGLIGGGAVGALAGSHMGNGGGIATLAGAAIGAIAGSFAEKGIKGSQTGMEYTVKLTNGQLKTITQGPEPLLHKGQKVLVQISASGKSRVVALS
jgi:outer membrane lipoprotein SlyB